MNQKRILLLPLAGEPRNLAIALMGTVNRYSIWGQPALTLFCAKISFARQPDGWLTTIEVMPAPARMANVCADSGDPRLSQMYAITDWSAIAEAVEEEQARK